MLNISDELGWVSSLGGPLIVMDRSLMSNWSGDVGPGNHRFQESVSDYDRACEVEGYVGTVEIDGGKALVLNDLPSQTTAFSVDSKRVLLARWIWAENEDYAKDALRRFDLEQLWNDTGLYIRFETGELVLFDSVIKGSELVASIRLVVESGSFGISYFAYQPDDQTRLFMIKLEQSS